MPLPAETTTPRLPRAKRRAALRAAVIIAEYSKGLREAEVHVAGPMKGRIDPEVWREILEFRNVIDQLQQIAA